MYTRVIIVPYNNRSISAKKLQHELKQYLDLPVLQISKNSTTYQPRWNDYVINWGCSKEWPWINLNDKVGHATCVDKLTFFREISKNPEINLPEWTEDKEQAKNWETTFLARTKLNGHSGEGIIIVDDNTQYIPTAPLYVKYKKKKHEYRVHFFKEKETNTIHIIDTTQKKKKIGAPNLDTKIRNYKNGWIYARENITKPDDLHTQTLLTATAVDLDFGAVDLIWNEYENKSYVLEVNTAPGITETTLNNYITAFLKDIKNEA